MASRSLHVHRREHDRQLRGMMGRVDPNRLSLHAGTLRPVQRFEEKAALAAQAGFGAWALRGVELKGYLAGGRTIGEVRQLNEKHRLAISETGSLMQWQFTGGVPLLNSFQKPDGATDKELLARADRLLGWTRALGCDLVAAIWSEPLGRRIPSRQTK